MRHDVLTRLGTVVGRALQLIVFVLPATASAQEFDLGPVPAVVIDCIGEADGAGSLAPDSSIDGEWLQFRRDRKLTGRSPLIGNITCPEHLWTIDLGARNHWVAVTPGSGDSQVELPATGESGNPDAVWNDFQINGADLDLAGNGQFLSRDERGLHKIVDYLPTVPGFERLICHPEWGSVANRCYLLNWVNDEWQEVWHEDLSHFDNNAGGSRPIVGDFDNDGEPEAAVLAWYQMHLLDLATGDHEDSGEFHDPMGVKPPTGRAYGWFGAFNLDDGPEQEFVIMGDFEHFISVIGWQNGELTELWKRRFHLGIYQNFIKHHVGLNPVADVNGDGYRDIVTSIFNDGGDDLWHVVAYDGSTGAVVFDWAGKYLSGLGDVDGDDVAELLITDTAGPGIPEYSDISVRSFDGGFETVLWQGSSSGFQVHDFPSHPDHVNAGSTLDRRTAFLRDDWNGSPVFITRTRAGNDVDVTLTFYQWTGSSIAEIASATGPRLTVRAMPETNPTQGILVQSRTETANEGPLQLTNLTGSLKSSGRVSLSTTGPGSNARFSMLLTSTVVGSLRANTMPSVIAQDYDQQIRAYRISAAGPEMLWREKGHGMRSGASDRIVSSASAVGSVLLADVTGSGDLAVVAADNTDSGSGVIKFIDADGTVFRNIPLPAPGARPVWNDGGITHWMAGKFTATDHEDVLVSIRRQTQHNHELHLINGQTGDIVWSETDGGVLACNGPIEGPGGGIMTVFDWDADGLDDFLDDQEGRMSVFKGADASKLLQRYTTGLTCGEPNLIFTQDMTVTPLSIVEDFLGTGVDHVLFAKNRETLALLTTGGDALWNTPFGTMAEFTLQAVADLDGNGDLEVVTAGHNCENPGVELQVHEADTGVERWALSMPELCEGSEPKAMASGDLDGNGKDEVYLVDANVLYVLHENAGAGELLWRATFGTDGAEAGVPVIAEVGNVGRPQILINSKSGYVYGLGYAGRFDDAPPDYWAFEFIETLARSGITAGCGAGSYCPLNPVTRAQMAVFLERGMNGGGYSPPAATGNVFLDVGAADFAASFIEQLAADGITAGCGNNNYCPGADVTRDQMAVFLLRAKHGSSYSPPPATGVFTDVPAGRFAANWIEQLAAEGITSGCGGGNYCPDAAVTRDQMAVFLVRTFGL